MLLLYSKLVGNIPKQLNPKKQPFQITSDPSVTELNQETSADKTQIKLNEEIRQVKETYYIDRRFL